MVVKSRLTWHAFSVSIAQRLRILQKVSDTVRDQPLRGLRSYISTVQVARMDDNFGTRELILVREALDCGGAGAEY